MRQLLIPVILLSQTALAKADLPGPECTGDALSARRARALVLDAEETSFKLSYMRRGYRVAEAEVGTAERRCESDGDQVSCDDWQEDPMQQLNKLAFYLEVADGKYGPAMYRYDYEAGFGGGGAGHWSETHIEGIQSVETLPIGELGFFVTTHFR